MFFDILLRKTVSRYCLFRKMFAHLISPGGEIVPAISPSNARIRECQKSVREKLNCCCST